MELNHTPKLCQTVEQFCQFIENLPPEALAQQAWGPREVLAHLVFHHELYVNLAEANIFGTPHVALTGKYREINAGAVAINRGFSSGELTARLRQANQRLVELYERYDPAKTCVQIKAGVKVRSLAELVPEVEAHIRNHLLKLQKLH